MRILQDDGRVSFIAVYPGNRNGFWEFFNKCVARVTPLQMLPNKSWHAMVIVRSTRSVRRMKYLRLIMPRNIGFITTLYLRHNNIAVLPHSVTSGGFRIRQYSRCRREFLLYAMRLFRTRHNVPPRRCNKAKCNLKRIVDI